MDKVEFAKELKGERVILKKHVPTMEYAEKVFAVLEKNQAEVSKYLNWANRLSNAEEYLNNFIIKTKDMAEYAIMINDELIGQIGFSDIDYRHGIGSIRSM